MTTVQTLEVELPDFVLRRRSLQVSHVASGSLERGLEPGELVLLHDRVRGFWAARVADLDFELADTVYRLDIGVRLSAAEASELALGRREAAAPGPVSKQELLDLLGRLRGLTSTAPASRRRTDTAL